MCKFVFILSCLQHYIESRNSVQELVIQQRKRKQIMSENNKAIDERCDAIDHWKTLD